MPRGRLALGACEEPRLPRQRMGARRLGPDIRDTRRDLLTLRVTRKTLTGIRPKRVA
jgi:hypothetical protein